MMRSCSMASVAEPAPTLSATSCQSKPVGASRSSSGVTSLVVTSALSGGRLLLGRCLLPCFQLSDASLQRGDLVRVASHGQVAAQRHDGDALVGRQRGHVLDASSAVDELSVALMRLAAAA